MRANQKILLFQLTMLSAALLVSSSTEASTHPSFSPQKISEADTIVFYPNADYDPNIPVPKTEFRHEIGQWPVRYRDVVEYINTLAKSSDRVILETHAQTHEGRDLFNLFISSSENISKLEEYRTNMTRLADPTQTITAGELESLLNELPAFAWLAYSIHGDEISGVDAAMQLAYHLAAARDSATMHLLKNVIVIIDPIENPDGRERYLSMLETYKSAVPNYDRQSLQHGGVWPAGRGNHYLFDMNRDWILVNQPETKGRLQTILKWNPVMTVDAHEMGSDETFLFTPPREPINANTPANVRKWWEVFSREQASAFDKRQWPYYIKEWHEQWYPGYGSAWSTFFGSVGILYEQASVDGSFVKQSSDYLLSFHEAVNHQFTSSLANLFTAANNRRQLLEDYRSTRTAILEKGKTSGLKFLIAPENDRMKLNKFVQSLLDQGIEISRATAQFNVSKASDLYGKEHTSKNFPAGTYIVSTAQTNGALAKTILEFDPHFSKEFLQEERRELEKYGDTRVYEVTAWSTAQAYDLDIYSTTSAINVSAEKVIELTSEPGRLINPDAQFAFVVNFEGEATYRSLNRLFQNKITVFASEKPFRLENNDYKAGSLVIRKRGNPDNLVQVLEKIAQETGLEIRGVNTGSSQGGSYLGAGTNKLLQQPKVALLAGSPIDWTSFGSIWFALDKQIEMPHSLIYVDALNWIDLSAYNVLIMPSSWGGAIGDRIGKGGTEKIKSWVKNGGTLICVGASAAWAADSSTGLSQVRERSQVLDKLEKYVTAVQREQQADQPEIDTIAIWHPEKIVKKEEEKKEEKTALSKEKAEEHDKWLRRFFPRGVIMNAAVDTSDWLAFGMKTNVPVMMYTDNTFLSEPPVNTVARFTAENDIRISGLLWPEARERWAESAFATREASGNGQIILFADEPNMRAYFYGTRRMLMNAVLYGPGMGTAFEVPYKKKD